MSVGLFRLEKGNSIIYEYTYEEMKIILDGEFIICDGSGEEVVATAGDLFYFEKGSVITFRTNDFGLAYFVGQRGADEAWFICRLIESRLCCKAMEIYLLERILP